jgi:hypothetical protein
MVEFRVGVCSCGHLGLQNQRFLLLTKICARQVRKRAKLFAIRQHFCAAADHRRTGTAHADACAPTDASLVIRQPNRPHPASQGVRFKRPGGLRILFGELFFDALLLELHDLDGSFLIVFLLLRGSTSACSRSCSEDVCWRGRRRKRGCKRLCRGCRAATGSRTTRCYGCIRG